MKIKYVTGSLLDCIELCVLHGCNEQKKMRSGIAKAIREKYPEAYIEYANAYDTMGLHLGDVIWAESGGKLIANGITQEYYGYDNKRYIDYDAINRVMSTVHKEAMLENFSVAMPLIGSGLGGGSWKQIVSIIEQNFTEIEPVVYILDGIIPENWGLKKCYQN